MQPNLPTGNNINWTLAISMIVALLAYFGISVPANVQTAAATIIGALPTIITGITVIVVWFLHNVINKPENKIAAQQFARECASRSVTAGKVIAPVMLACLLMLGMGSVLAACSTLESVLGSVTGSGSAQASVDLADGGIAAAGTMQSLIATCQIGNTGATGLPSFCTDAAFKSNAKTASAALVAAYAAGQTLVAQGGSATNVEADVAALLAAYTTFESALSSSTSARTALDIGTTVTIAEQVIDVVLAVYQQITSLNASASSSGVTAAQLAQIGSTIQAANASIQAW